MAQTRRSAVAIWTLDCGVRGQETAGRLLQDRAASELGVHLERTGKLWLSPLGPLIVHSVNNSPHPSSSACPARKLHLPSASIVLHPRVTAGPAPLGVDIWARRSQVQFEIIWHQAWGAGGAISSEQKAGAVAPTEHLRMGCDEGFWSRVHVVRVSSSSPEAVWWVALLVCLSDDRLRGRLVWVSARCKEGGDVTEELKPERGEGL